MVVYPQLELRLGFTGPVASIFQDLRFRPVPQNVSSILALHSYVHYTAQMQGLSSTISYAVTMTAKKSRIRHLREKAGMSLRELARILDEQPTNISYWERTGRLPRSDLLVPMAAALGVTVEDILGVRKPRQASNPAGRMRKLFEQASKLPRRQQQKVADVLEPFIAQYADKR